MAAFFMGGKIAFPFITKKLFSNVDQLLLNFFFEELIKNTALYSKEFFVLLFTQRNPFFDENFY